jgi:hypothetical protein
MCQAASAVLVVTAAVNLGILLSKTAAQSAVKFKSRFFCSLITWHYAKFIQYFIPETIANARRPIYWYSVYSSAGVVWFNWGAVCFGRR